MTRTVHEVIPAHEEALRWCRRHGLNPSDFNQKVTIVRHANRVWLNKFKRDRNGDKVIRDGAAVTVPFLVIPAEPFPDEALNDGRFVCTAEFGSICLVCHDDIEPGADIVHLALDDAWVHLECA